jgi:uncharacterized protein CbrC (UPF0167 family)
MHRAFSFFLLGLAGLSLAASAAPAQAADLSRTRYAARVFYPPSAAEAFCPWCIRDAIYANTKLIAHLEANPDIDESVKGPIVLNARAEVHYLRWMLGPVHRVTAGPCCYTRKPIYVR